MKWLMPAFVAVSMLCRHGSAGVADDVATPHRPNILWISAEDISAATLGCYGGEARTPRIDALARGGLRFDAAFSAAPVCAPSRSAIITGMMPTTLGTLPMRCHATPPAHVVGFPKLLRAAGYFCTNNAKTDYNFAPGFTAGWDQSNGKAHWRNRPDPAQPFFAVFNLGVTHESGLFGERPEQVRNSLPAEVRADPATITVPAYYPDTPLIRTALAQRLDLAAALDRDVGLILDQLATDGLADTTIVVFWGDHGEGIPHGKRWLNEHGLRVPLIVQAPERFRDVALLPQDRPAVGSAAQLVNLMDLAPTMLDLAGVAIPNWMEGRSFLGPHATACDHVISVRDRMDEAPGFSRSVRDARLRYVRNFLPWIDGDDLPAYADGVAITGELRRTRQAGTLPESAGWFSRTSRPTEELHDLAADPDELVELAGDPAHEADLGRLRDALRSWMRSTRDTGVLPEPMLRAEAARAGSEWAIFHPPTAEEQSAAAHRYDVLLDAAWAVADARSVGQFSSGRAHSEPAARYWAACGTGWSAARTPDDPQDDATAAAALQPLLADSDPAVRLAAARWFVVCAADDEGRPGLDVLGAEMRSTNPDIRFAALAAIDQLADRGRPLWADAAALEPVPHGEYSSRLVEGFRRKVRPDAPGARQ